MLKIGADYNGEFLKLTLFGRFSFRRISISVNVRFSRYFSNLSVLVTIENFAISNWFHLGSNLCPTLIQKIRDWSKFENKIIKPNQAYE